jgi:hypothetical protein
MFGGESELARLLQVLTRMLSHIRDGDWKSYRDLCDPVRACIYALICALDFVPVEMRWCCCGNDGCYGSGHDMHRT